MVAMTNKKLSQKLFLLFVAIYVMGSISVPSVHAEVGVAAAAADDDDGETLDMDAPIVEEKSETETKVEEEEEKVVGADAEPEVVEKEVEPEPEPEPEPVVADVTVEEEIPAAVEGGEEESTEEIIERESGFPNKISIPFLDKVTKQDVKKIAAFSLGAWGAATGVGWAMQQFGGDQKLD